MPKSEELEKYGEPLTYDRTFKGPLSKRSCTDVICLLIFVAFLGVWGYVAFYAISKGDLQKLLVPTDSNNQKCGVDSRVLNEPYLFFFNLENCVNPLVTISGCPTPQRCVKQCPQETFVYDNFQGTTEELKKKLICMYDINVDSLSRPQIGKLIDEEKCARWYVKSKPFLNRCIWEFSSTICEYIPSYIIDRTKRDLSIFQHERYNNSQLLPNDDITFNGHEPIPISSRLILEDFQNKISRDINSKEALQIFDQKKIAEEPQVQCRIRQQLGEQVIMEKMKRTDTYLGRFIGNIVEHFYKGPSSQELGQQIVEDIVNSWKIISLAIILAMVASLIFIIVMRWIATPMVWISIIGAIAALCYCVYLSAMQYVYYKNNPNVPHHSPNLSSTFKTWAQDKDFWLVITIIVSIVDIIILLIIIFLRKRIVIAIALIKEGSKAVGTIISSIFFPIFPWILHVGTIVFAIIVALYLASIGDSSFKVIGKVPSDTCKCSGQAALYSTGSECVPEVFSKNCFDANSKSCADSACAFEKLNAPTIVGYFHAINVIGFFWLAFFISAFGEMVLAATFATWYWTFHKSDVPYFTLTRAFGRTVRYHLGTLAFGSLIVTICRLIRVILEYIDAKLKKFDNACTKAILCCMKCFFWCLENFLRFINKNAYIMCAIHGKNFCTSAKDAFNLLMRNCLRVVTLDKVTEFLFFLSKILLTAAAGVATYYFVERVPEENHLHYNAVPTVIVVIATYLITTVFFGVYSMAVDTLFLCFLEDSERNDGSAEKPYYMSKQLMKILGRRNEIPRHQYI